MKTIAVLLLSCALARGAFDKFQCVSMLETGGDDSAVGAAGEVSRFGIMPGVWTRYARLPLSAARNPFTALNVAEDVMRDRETEFNLRHRREATDFEWALLWHCPGRLGGPTASDRDYARRFVNLRSVR